MSETRQLEAAVADLLTRAQAGDAAARDELLRTCHPTVYRWALVHTGNPDDADDVSQEVLVRLCTRLNRYAGRSRFTTWLYQMTRNAAFGMRRKVVSALRLVERVARQPAGEIGDDPVARLDSTRVREIVMDLFKKLPQRQREVFHLADIEGLSPIEIAEWLNMNPVTVRAHLFRARRALRARILEQYPEIVEDRWA